MRKSGILEEWNDGRLEQEKKRRRNGHRHRGPHGPEGDSGNWWFDRLTMIGLTRSP